MLRKVCANVSKHFSQRDRLLNYSGSNRCPQTLLFLHAR
jgi:hypothetical protein